MSKSTVLINKEIAMKYFLIIMIMSIISTSIFGQNVGALDDKYGFRDAIFEKPKTSFKNLVAVDGEKYFYKSTTENLTLGKYKLQAVYYHFYRGQLEGIAIQTEGSTNSRGILKILQLAYGDGDQENEYIKKYEWLGEKVKMIYDQNSITDDATIILMSVKLNNLEQAEKKKADADATKEL